MLTIIFFLLCFIYCIRPKYFLDTPEEYYGDYTRRENIQFKFWYYLALIASILLSYCYYDEIINNWWSLGKWLFNLNQESSGNWWILIFYVVFGLNLLLIILLLLKNSEDIIYAVTNLKWRHEKFALFALEKDIANEWDKKVAKELWQNLDFCVQVLIIASSKNPTPMISSIINPEWFISHGKAIEDISYEDNGYDGVINLLTNEDRFIIKRNEDFLTKLGESREFIKFRDSTKELNNNERIMIYVARILDIVNTNVRSEIIKNLGENIHFITEIYKNLSIASEKLCDNKYIVKSLIANDGLQLRFASKRLQNDYSIVRVGIDNNVKSFEYAGDLIKDDYYFLSYAISKSWESILFANKRLMLNHDLGRLAFKSIPIDTQYDTLAKYKPDSYYEIDYTKYPLLENKGFVEEWLKVDWKIYNYLPFNFLQDEELFHIAMRNGMYQSYIQFLRDKLLGCSQCGDKVREENNINFLSIIESVITVDILKKYYLHVPRIDAIHDFNFTHKSKPFIKWALSVNLYNFFNEYTREGFILSKELYNDDEIREIFTQHGWGGLFN